MSPITLENKGLADLLAGSLIGGESPLFFIKEWWVGKDKIGVGWYAIMIPDDAT
jgi:hypothetical protein